MSALPPPRFLDRTTPPKIVTLILLAGLSALAMNIFLPSLPGMAADFGVSYGVMQQSVALYQHDSQPAGYKWVEALRASVRPILTYAFFMLFAAVKIAGLYTMVSWRFPKRSATLRNRLK